MNGVELVGSENGIGRDKVRAPYLASEMWHMAVMSPLSSRTNTPKVSTRLTRPLSCVMITTQRCHLSQKLGESNRRV